MAAPATPSTLTDRELVFELITVETEVIQQLDAFRDILEDVDIGKYEFAILSKEFCSFKERLEGDFVALVTAVSDRLDPAAVDAYFESPEGAAWRKENGSDAS